MTSAAESGLAAVRSTRMDTDQVDPSAIERELRRLTADSSPDARTVRACMSNLIVYCEDEKQADGIPPELGDLVEQHPARILLLVGNSDALSSGVSAEVAALCYLASGGRQICSDHVRIRAAQGARRRLPSAVRPLLVGDLPTALCWATPEPPPANEILGQLAPMAEQVIYDSEGWTDPARGVVLVADWSTATRGRVTDLAWTRLAPWRRLLSETFDPQRLPGGIDAIREIALRHGPHSLTQGFLLIGWLAHCLGWKLRSGQMRAGVDVTWTLESRSGPVQVTLGRLPEGSPRIREISIRAQAGNFEAVATFASPEAERMSLCVDGGSCSENVVALRPLSKAALLASHLSERSANRLFRDVLSTSRALAKAVMH